MRFRRAVVCVAVAFVTAPEILQAQITISGISLSDVERAVRVGRVILDATSGRRREPPSRRRRSDPSGGEVTSADGTVLSSGRASRTARRVIATGDEYVGVPYEWGGTSPRGFDCSGFIQYVYREHGVFLPRTSRQMAHAGRPLPARVGSLREGDLMLFRGRNGVINHVALYAGGNRILHSSSSGNGVRYDDLSSRRGAYYRSHLVAARRVTEDGRSLVQALSSINRMSPFDYFDPPDEAPRR